MEKNINYYLESCGFLFPTSLETLENFNLLFEDYKIPEDELLEPSELINIKERKDKNI